MINVSVVANGYEEWYERCRSRIDRQTKREPMSSIVSLNKDLLKRFTFMKGRTIEYNKLLDIEFEGIDSVSEWVRCVIESDKKI